MNLVLIEAVTKLGIYYGDEFKVEFPTRSGNLMTLREVARELGNRVIGTFLRSESAGGDGWPAGYRPVYGGTTKFQTDPYWRDLVLFYEYFHGDNGAGIGASHQTGWTGAVATLISGMGAMVGDRILEILLESEQGQSAELVGSGT
jgi:hypothetical protein